MVGKLDFLSDFLPLCLLFQQATSRQKSRAPLVVARLYVHRLQVMTKTVGATQSPNRDSIGARSAT